MYVIFLSNQCLADNIYTDTWVNWTPIGKTFDVVCFTKAGPPSVLKNIRIMQFNRKAFQYKETVADAELKAMASKNCFFDQHDTHPVSRDEFFEEIVSVKCSLNSLPFKDGDFRILGTNSVTTSVKRLRDGKVWILPTNDCSFTTQLAKKPMVPAGMAQGPVQMSGELVFPGQADQPATVNLQPSRSRNQETLTQVAPEAPETMSTPSLKTQPTEAVLLPSMPAQKTDIKILLDSMAPK